MPKIKYIDKQIRQAGLDKIAQVNAIIEEYQEQGYSLTLRQVYYQLVSKNIIPNSERSYDNIGNLIKDGRLVGLIDWDGIEDRTRHFRTLSHWNNPNEILRSAAYSYRIDLWQNQEFYVECWVEKDALISIVEQASNRYDVPCTSCRGYESASIMWRSAQRLIEKSNEGRTCIILHLGDHDPSGTDMSRDIGKRLHELKADVEIKRIALTMQQIELYNPPPQPAKKTDSRFKKYKEEHGANSWELDALEPSVLDELIGDNIVKYLDIDLFEETKIRQEEERKQLIELAG